MIARQVVLLVRRVVLFVDDDEPDLFEWGEHRGARAHDDGDFTAPDAVPLVVTLAVGKAAVLDGDLPREAISKKTRKNGRQSDLRREDQHAPPRRGDERSQLQNRARAMEVLRSRMQAQHEAELAAEASAERRSQVRTVDRSERIRTYNFPENRISDHRIGYKAHNLSAVLDGDLGDVLAALAAAERAQSVGA